MAMLLLLWCLHITTAVCCVITLLTCQVQLLGYNGQLYSSEAAALKSPNGGVGIAVLAQVGEKTNTELEKIIKAASTLKYAGENTHTLLLHIIIPYSGSSTSLTSVSLSSLVPSTSQMITYEGSLTQPGCQVRQTTGNLV